MAREHSDGSAVEKDVGFEIDKELKGRFLAGGIYERDRFRAARHGLIVHLPIRMTYGPDLPATEGGIASICKPAVTASTRSRIGMSLASGTLPWWSG
jgi:hypothetical protein